MCKKSFKVGGLTPYCLVFFKSSDTGTTKVIINLEDVNDNKPVLTSGHYTYEIYEDFSFSSVSHVYTVDYESIAPINVRVTA